MARKTCFENFFESVSETLIGDNVGRGAEVMILSAFFFLFLFFFNLKKALTSFKFENFD